MGGTLKTMKTSMTASERVHAALQGEPVDRVPFCFWHHFRPEGSGERLARATLEFFVQKFNLDIVKIMPDLPYPAPADKLEYAQQLRFLPRIEPDSGSFQEQLRCISLLRDLLGPEYPLVLTVFSPLTTLFNLLGKQNALTMARQDPAPFEEGLGTLASNLRRFLQAAIEAGASGIFFSSMGATSNDFSPEEYIRFGRPYDLDALAGASAGWLNICHIHADPEQSDDQIYFELFADYPVSVISWSDRLTGPDLSEALTLTDKCLMGGLWERGAITRGSETELENEILSAISQTHGRRLILANGCSIPDNTPEEWLHTARRLVTELR